MKLAIIFSFVLLQATVTADEEIPKWYRCIVEASSHKAFYTFKINTKPCKIYWQEIDTEIKISECNLPIISGLKPSAQDKYSVVWFNLETGDFYDYLSGVKDRGKCTASIKEPAPWSTNR
jgi:hypothetical protein